MTILPGSIVERAPNLAQRLFEERMLVITSRDSVLHRFNEVGTFIWQILDKPLAVREIFNRIQAHFAGYDEKESQKEIYVFLEGLKKKGLISIQKDAGAL